VSRADGDLRIADICARAARCRADRARSTPQPAAILAVHNDSHHTKLQTTMIKKLECRKLIAMTMVMLIFMKIRRINDYYDIHCDGK
jgi:hypothetical protein